MLVHVALKANISGYEGVLTYRAPGARVGQLVLLRLRGRRQVGVVVEQNVPAGTSQQILPVLAQSDNPLPASFVSWLRQVSDWYGLPLSPTLAQLATDLNGRYLIDEPIPIKNGAQRVWLTPAETTPLAVFLRGHGVGGRPDSQPERRRLWQAAASGQTLDLVGTAAVLNLPFRNLTKLTIETPLSSSYYSDRTPGFQAAVLGCLLAAEQRAELNIRSSVPLPLLARRLPLPPQTTLQRPPLHQIEVIPTQARGRLNRDLIGAIKHDLLKPESRVLIFHNHLPGVSADGRPIGISQLAQRLSLDLEQPVGVVSARTPLPDTAVVVATSTTLYRLSDKFTRAIVLNADELISPNRPWSYLSALETLGVLASRAPLTAQITDQSGLIARALEQQLEPGAVSRLPWPDFERRLLRGPQAGLLPDSWTEIAASPERVMMAPRLLSDRDKRLIADWREHGRVFSDEWTWPPISDTVGAP